MRYHQNGFSFLLTPVVKILIAGLVVSYLFFALFARTSLGSSLYYALILEPSLAVEHFQIWRILTYSLLHSITSPFHVLFNGLMLYILGPQLESLWGSRYFTRFVVLTALGGGIFVCMGYVLGLTNSPVLGFSAVTLGLLVAWGLTFSRQTILLFGVVPLTGKQIVWLIVGLELLYLVGVNDISSAAHFGGMATAAILTLEMYTGSYLKNLYQKSKWRLKKRRSHLRVVYKD